MNKVAITGAGIFSSIGRNIKEFSESLKKGKTGIRFIHYNSDDPDISVNMGALLPLFSFKDTLKEYSFIGKNILQKAKKCSRAPLSIQVSVLSAMEAYTNAMLHKNKADSERIALVVAGSNISPKYGYDLYKSFQKKPQYLSPAYPLHYMDTDHIGVLSEIFQIKGEGFTTGCASASGNAAIINGSRLIQLGIADVCLVVGPMADLSPMELQGFYNVGAMGGKNFADMPDKVCRPFDKEAEGFVYGQSGACIVLESAESAKKRKAKIIAKTTGGSIVLDGNSSSNPNKEGEIRAMLMALKNGGIYPEKVDYINAHGTSSPLGDKTEICAIKKVFGKNISKLWINSTKGLTGHPLYSAGVVEAVAVIIQMNQNFVHPNINLYNPIDENCRFAGFNAEPAEIGVALSNSFGFGGINTSVVFMVDGKS
jgi:malonyl-ACP decarboxylase